ncbi:MAG TPA: hypothetical protein VIX59_16960 [Candidatus Binataceae bacterium]
MRQAFDREPIGFSHNLSGLDLFTLESLHALAEKMADSRDYFIAASAPLPGTPFFSVPMVDYKPPEAIEKLDMGAYRILLKRAENHDRRFRALLDTLSKQVIEFLGCLANQKIVRLESGILISSAATITPFHCDPEIGFFSQIEGEKTYHVYSPTVISERELERFSIAGPVALAPVELNGRNSVLEYVHSLSAGKGFHQPQNSPHWVETGKSRSISYTFVFETDATRALGRTRAFNHYLRKFRLSPAALGARPAVDALKSDAMRAAIPARQLAARIVNKVRFG